MSRSIASPSSLLSWKNPLWLDMLLSGWNWKPIALFSKSSFTLMKKNARELLVGNNKYTRDEGFLEGLWRKRFSTRLISCYYFGFIQRRWGRCADIEHHPFSQYLGPPLSLICFSCFNSVSYAFHYSILRKQTSNIIMIKILTAIIQYISNHEMLYGNLLEVRQFLLDLVLLMFMSTPLA